jgi:outer membrane protein insertion porin family
MKRIIIIINIFFFLYLNIANSEVINKININGNERIAVETIILFSKVNIGFDIQSDDLNEILKNLYETNFFSNVSVEITDNILNINIEENPIIQTVIFDGIKTKKLKKQFLDTIKLKEKNSFIDYLAKQDVIRIKNGLKKSGYYFSEVNLSIQKNNNNTVNLIYNIDLGKKALIHKIRFVGDKIYKDRKLRNVITTEETKFWKFLSSNKYLNQEKISLDQRLLKSFYLNKGFYKVKISNSYTQMLDDNSFIVTFNINAGKKYKFNNSSLVLPEDYDRKKFIHIEKKLQSLKNEYFSLNKVEKILDEIEKLTLREQFEFIDASVEEKIIANNQIDFIISISESLNKYYVDKINILGNNITSENVIRNSFLIDEGDPYNKILLNKSINNIKSLNIFKSVDSVLTDSTKDNKKIIEITVEEKATGEISAGAGVGTSGSSIAFGIKENNYLGKGIVLNSNLSLDEESIKGSFSYINPNYKNSDRSLLLGLNSTSTDRLAEFGYKSSNSGFSIGTSYEQYDDIFFLPRFAFQYDKIETSNTASDSLKKQKGDYFDFNLSYAFDHDERNQRFQPSSGYRQVFFQELPLISKNYSLTNSYSVDKYLQFTDDLITTISFYGKTITSLKSSKDVRISKRLIMPSRRLRGFEPGKIGPVDNSDFVGGNYLTAFNINTDIPTFVTSENVDFKLFYDAANLWGNDYKNNDGDSNKIRSSTGIAVDWFTPVGPLNFSLAQPLSKKNSDKTETFRFTLGTTF